jgi:hypothetical protein
MPLPGRCSITTDSAKRLPSRRLRCRRGCSSSPCQVSRGMLPYVFLRRTQLTTTPQRPSTGRDQNGRQRPPWCPTPDADAHNGHPVCWLIVVCGGAGSGAPWRPWDDGDRQGRRGTLLLALASFYLAKAHITTHNNQSIWPNRRCADDNIVAGTGDHDKNQYARGPQDDLQADLTPYHVGCCVSLTSVAGAAGTNSYLKYKFVPGG